MKIRTKIGGGYLLLFIAVLVIGVISIENIKRVNEFTELAAKESKHLNLVSRLEILMLRQSNELSSLFHGNEDAWVRFENFSNLFRQTMDEIFSLYKTQKKEDANLIELIKNKHREYISTARTAYDLYLNYRPTETNKIIDEKLDPLLEQILQSCDEQINLQKAQAVQYELESNKTKNSALLKNKMLLIAALIVAIILGAVITLNITRSLHLLQKGTEIVGNGNLDHKIGGVEKDEIGWLSTAFDRMTEKLKTTTISLEQANEDLKKKNTDLESRITERKEAEKALRESEERFSKITSSVKDGIIMINHEGKISYWNPAAGRIFGYSFQEIAGHALQDTIIPAQYREKHVQAFKTFQKTKKGKLIGQTIELLALKKNGDTFPLELSLSSMWLKDRLHAIGVVRDITKRKREEEDLRTAKEEAEAANFAKSEFLANMSHEIRTPLNAVIGFSELLYSLVTDKKQRNYLESIETAGKSLLTLINDILDLSKMEAGRMEVHYEAVSPHMLFNEIRQVFEVKFLNKGLDFIMEIDPDLPSSLLLDEIRLRQALFNLVGNAIKFTEKGYVSLSVAKVFKDDEANTLDLTISVQDTGIGIPKEHRDSVFDSFKQQDTLITRKYGGTGLGLSITKRLIELMNGRISVKGVEGGGCLFEVILRDVPVASARALPHKEDASFDYRRISFEKGRVLVVDDVSSNRNLIKAALSKTGLEVVEAEDGEKALLFAKEYHPDLILMDIRMPVMDGYEATREIKENSETKDIPVVALTASSTAGSPNKLEESGFDGFLSKPVTMRWLFEELSRFLTPVEKPEPTMELTYGKEPLESMTPEELKRLPDLIRTLREEFMPQWEESKGAMEMEVVEGFSEKLLQLAQDYKVSGLISYAKDLGESTRNFDVEKMEAALKEFPIIVKMIEEKK